MPYPRLTGTLAMVAVCVSLGAHAQTRELHIPSGDLKTALDHYARQTGVQLLYNADDVKGLSTRGVDGALPQDQALAALLDNSGLSMKRDGGGAIVLFRDAAPAQAPVDEVVVTGSAGKHSKIQTSYSITTINEETLRMQAPTSVTEALKSVPGFWVEASGGEASGNIRARGIPVDGFGSVTLLEDGIPVMHDPALGYLNADQAFRLDETIDRIEVVRGGPSSVFYSNAPAGAINFRSREIGDAPNGLVKLTIGDYGLHREDFWYATPLADGWGIGMGGFQRTDHGIRSPGFHADTGGQGRLKLSKELDHGRFTADLKHMDDKVYLDLGIPMVINPGGSYSPVAGFNGNYGTIAGPQTQHVIMKTGDGGSYDFDNTEGTHVKRDQLSLTLEKELPGDWKLNEAMRFSQTDTQRNGIYPNQIMSIQSLLSGSQALLAYVPGATQLALQATGGNNVGNYSNPNGLVLIGGLRAITMPVHEQVNDLHLGRMFELAGQTHNVTAGYYYAHFTQDFDRYSSSVLLGAQSNAPLLDLVGTNAAGAVLGSVTDHGIYNYGYEWAHAGGTSTTNAFYLSDEWQLNKQLRIDAGVRNEQVETAGWTELSKTVNLGGFSSSKMLTGSGRVASYDHSFRKTGWTLGANYQLDRDAGLFGRWTNAFRLPNLSSYITSPTATPIIQTMGLGEIGYKYKSALVEFYPTMFYTKYDNVSYTNQVFSLNNATVVPVIGYASTKTYGLELEGKLNPAPWADLGFDATLQRPKYQDLIYNDNVNGQPVARNYDGRQLIRVPRASYRVVPGLNLFADRLRLQLSYEYEGKRFVDAANTVVLPSYQTVNFSSRYALSKATTLYFYIDNLNNSLGLTEGNPRAGEIVSADAGANAFIARPLLGRTMRLAAMYQF